MQSLVVLCLEVVAAHYASTLPLPIELKERFDACQRKNGAPVNIETTDLITLEHWPRSAPAPMQH